MGGKTVSIASWDYFTVVSTRVTYLVETTSGVVLPVFLSPSLDKSNLFRLSSALKRSDCLGYGVPISEAFLSPLTDVTEQTLSTFIVDPGGSLNLFWISFLFCLDPVPIVARILSDGVATWRPPSRESMTPGSYNFIVLTPFEFLDGESLISIKSGFISSSLPSCIVGVISSSIGLLVF